MEWACQVRLRNAVAGYARCALMLKASFSGMPGTAAISFSVAFRIASIDPKWLINLFRRAGPTPGTASSSEALPYLARRPQ